ncbi:MAG: hypothetical protein HKN33_17820 [Pyrinomonadaceae bacterium]|nr:hypothetical protein [Pyrinomonadaceae bacterium]
MKENTFEKTGYIRIPDAFSVEDALPMREAIYRELEWQCDIDPDDPESWQSNIWPKFQNIKFDPIFDPIGGEKARAVLDELLGDWEEPSNWGQFLVSWPTGEEWDVPHYLWHTDFGYDTPAEPLPGLLFISFITDVGPRAAGTAVIEGSHKLVEKYVASKDEKFCRKMRRVRESLMVSDPWLMNLSDPETPNRNERFMDQETVVKGCRLRVAELTGETGDIIVAHPWLLHTSSKNCSGSISMRRVQRIKAR